MRIMDIARVTSKDALDPPNLSPGDGKCKQMTNPSK